MVVGALLLSLAIGWVRCNECESLVYGLYPKHVMKVGVCLWLWCESCFGLFLYDFVKWLSCMLYCIAVRDFAKC